MVGKCSNPSCSVPFRRLGRGKLFAFETGPFAGLLRSVSVRRSTKAVGAPLFFWLCETCSLTKTLGLDGAGHLIIQSLSQQVEGTILESKTGNRETQSGAR